MVTSGAERRRYVRHPLMLTIELRRGDQVMEACVVNLSRGGCLLSTAMELEAGEVVVASIPELKMPETRLHVLRTQPGGEGCMAALCFETTLSDEGTLVALSHSLARFSPAPEQLLH